MNLAYGRNRGVPDDVTTAWGARLIAPADLVHDRQDLVAASSETKAELIAWLNGTPSGTGAIDKALKWLRTNYAWEMPEDDEQVVLYEDDLGIIVGSTQASHGYVYAAGWLKVDKPSGYERRKLRAIRRETEIGRAHDALAASRRHVQRARTPRAPAAAAQRRCDPRSRGRRLSLALSRAGQCLRSRTRTDRLGPSRALAPPARVALRQA